MKAPIFSFTVISHTADLNINVDKTLSLSKVFFVVSVVQFTDPSSLLEVECQTP